MHKIITDAAAEPLLLADVKVHLRVDTTDDDALITALIPVAREFAEHYTGRSLVERTLEMALRCFPEYHIDLDASPVTSVVSIKYTDAAGVEQTVPDTDYTLSPYGDACRVSLGYLKQWPVTQDIDDAVRIQYVAGFTTLPNAARAAMLLLIGHLYENRQAVGAAKLSEVPMSAVSLLNTIKAWGK
jgi:phage conserved hypothetical protein, phiE125 gp8 family